MSDDHARHQLLRGVSGFLSAHDSRPAPDHGITLEDLDNQQLLADTDALLQSLHTASPDQIYSPHTQMLISATKLKSKQELAKEKAGQRRDAYRKRQKEERAILRLQDAELSRQLTKLQQFKRRETTQSAPGDTLALGAWKAIATRQYESRLESEALQKRLRAAVNSHALMIQDLETLLRKRMREVEKLTSVEVPELFDKKARLGMKDAMLYKTYFENLDALYERIDEVFQEVGVTPTPGGILSGEPTRKMDEDTEYLERIGEGRKVYDGLPDPENSLAFQFCSPHRRENGEVCNLRWYHVVRRYVEKSRMVVVWRDLCEADEEFPGLNSDETGWAVVHAPTNDDNFAATLVQACIRLVPMHFQCGNPDKEGEIGQFMALVVKTQVEDNQEIERMMERLLLDDALATDGLDIDENGDLSSLSL
ncbi:Rio kinase [Phytophthora cinnamomi]|uniref:Rio kinase n=1 Tax=Phytophthora cinnamomi TaxID=4785 RepID=UPI00355A44A2|nr:Rio kinase [Phytophthora cinnamomi]